VPAGNCTWTSGLVINKGINLIGAGIGATNIIANVPTYCGGQSYAMGNLIKYSPANYSLDTPFRLSGFTFDLGNMCNGLVLGESKSGPFTVQDQVRIDHNSWTDVSSVDLQAIWNFGVAYGVVDNNQFNIPYPIRNSPQVQDASWWANSPQNIFTPGGNTTLYYEDNVFTNITGPSDSILADGQFGTRYAFRYNTITINKPTYSLFEIHGYQPGRMPASFGVEVYGNLMNASTVQVGLVSVRSGKSYVFNNDVQTTDSFYNKAYAGSLAICPPSYHNAQLTNNSYFWGNRKNKTGAPFHFFDR
jgi:hypothetical protein